MRLNTSQTGFSLIELMISLVIGMIIVAAGITIFVNTASTDFYQLKVTRLNQELRTTMNLLTRDIRRVGYIGPNGLAGIIGTGSWNPFIRDSGSNFLFVLQDVNNADGVATSYDCVLFALDQDGNGTDAGDGERFGYRFANGAVQMRPNTAASTCTSNGWEAITDDNTINITSLTFIPHNQRVGSDNNLILCTIDISLTGQLISDSTVVRTINESVKLRNDIYDANPTTALCQ